MTKYLSFLFVLLSGVSIAQKKTLTHSVYDSWESITSKRLSNDGNWAGYGISQQEGDANLYFKHLNTNQSIKVPRADLAHFSADSKYAAFAIKPFYADIRTAKIKKKKAEEMTKDSLGIVNLNTLALQKIARVKSFKFPERGSFLAYHLEKPTDTSKNAKTDPKAKEEGTDLIVRNLVTGVERTFKFVSDYSFSKDGKLLAFAGTGSKSDKSSAAGAFLLNTERGTLKTLVRGPGTFKQFIFDEESESLAFLGEKSPEKAVVKDFFVYYNSLSLDTAQVLVDNTIPGMPDKWAVSGDGKLSFSKDGKKLFFGIAPLKAPKDTTLVDFEHAKLDIWSYKDDYLQPMQLKNVERENKRSYLSVIEIFDADVKIVSLADSKMPDAIPIAEGDSNYILSGTDYGNRIQSQWTGGSIRDYYLVDTRSGSKKKIISGLSGFASASPSGKYILYFDKKTANWYTYNVSSGNVTHLNNGVQEKLVDELNDMPDDASSYGIAAWTEDDKSVLLNDRFDIWEFSADGKKDPKNITNGYGRQNSITFRYMQVDPELKFLTKREDIWLEAFNNITKENGFYKTNVGSSKNPEQVIMAKVRYSSLLKSKEEERYIYDKGNYSTSPDVFVSRDLKVETKLSTTNIQQHDYNWGTAELVSWTTPKGFKSDGILYKPEDFDPGKKYPMIVYFYEKLSDGLYNYQPPAPTPSRLNIPFFVSNGYLVFAPDISYEAGYPGRSAEEFVNSGVEELKKNPWVDGAKIGLQGQSWGGYQVAHLITRTSAYAAAWAGAPVANMTSAYGGMRWESGMNRQFQYEKTQSRIGATLWEKPDRYIDNSPLFWLPNVGTPLVIMANDADGAVPWYQGIELFTGLRRLGKPAWLLNYNNEAHNLVQRQNRKDIQIRQQQFFDHYLKDSKAPVWMVDGIPAVDKGRTWGFELTDKKP